MTMDETTATRRSLYPTPSSLRNPVFAPGPVQSAELALFEAIDAQRLSLLNVLDIVHCISVGVTDVAEPPAPEIASAFELLECEIQRIAVALEKTSLRIAMQARPGSRYSPRLA
jgi:hypothetical protein